MSIIEEKPQPSAAWPAAMSATGTCGAFCPGCPPEVLWSFCAQPQHVKGPHRCSACGLEYYATLGT